MDEIKEQAPKEAKPHKAAPLVTVRIIRENGPTVLVEWSDKQDWRRAYIPKEVIHNLRVEAAELDAGTAYGVAWEDLAVVTATPQEIGKQLRRRGIWTRRDLETHFAEVQAAYMEAYGADFGGLLQKVRKLEED